MEGVLAILCRPGPRTNSLERLRRVAGLAMASAKVTERNNGITLSERVE